MNARLLHVTGVVFLLSFAASPTSGQGIPVKDDLAAMVEEVVAATGLSINISEQTRTSVSINEVNGRSVCAAKALADVKKLQSAFNGHRHIYRNIGPALVSTTDRDGTKSPEAPA